MVRYFLLIFLLIASPTFATDYYVDFDEGNDNSSGLDSDNAWKTLPGTRNSGDTGWQETEWGSPAVFSSGSKVPAGTTFKIKSGTQHDSTDGGRILVDSTYYDNGSSGSEIVFQRDSSWGAGAVTIDGTSIAFADVADALFDVTQRDYIQIDGVSSGGIIIRDATTMGLRGQGTSQASQQTGPDVNYVNFINNTTSRTSGQASGNYAQLRFMRVKNATINHCNFDGDSNYTNGMLMGDDDNNCTNIAVNNSKSYNHSPPDDQDSGFGFKAEDSTVTWTNCEAYSNYKGWDSGGEDNGEAETITYIHVNCKAYDNTAFGFANSTMHQYTATFKYINCLIYGNGSAGINIYGDDEYDQAHTLTAYIIHSTFYDNGGEANLRYGPNGCSDTAIVFKLYMYNNIFHKPASGSAANTLLYYNPVSNSSLYADYNSYTYRSADTELFNHWGYANNCGNTEKTFTYAALPEGNTGAAWYTDEDQSGAGTGHYQCDLNSVVGDPGLVDEASDNFTATASTPAGTDISGQGWYDAGTMGTDINGNTRSSWTMGAYEYEDTSCTNCGVTIN